MSMNGIFKTRDPDSARCEQDFRARLLVSAMKAADWLCDVAQIKDDDPPPCGRIQSMLHKTWKGSFMGEYAVATRRWDYFCPVWHGGQAIKALCAVYQLTGDEKYLSSAKLGADFIMRESYSDPAEPDYGLIWALEDSDSAINTSAVLECLDGLLALYEITCDPALKQAFLGAADWCARVAYQGQGHFLDFYSLTERRFIKPPWIDRFVPPDGQPKRVERPLLDDAIFLKAYKLSGNARYREIFFATADFLLSNECPEGTWSQYVPCGGIKGNVHPRHSYWWGAPMADAYLETGERKYLDCLTRAAGWYLRAQRRDGGLFRNTYADYSTDSFGHATSGTVCAAILWLRLNSIRPDEVWASAAKRSLTFAMSMQLHQTSDPNLKGVILEKVLPPDGTDSSPYHVRDLGSIFFLQAACAYLGSDG